MNIIIKYILLFVYFMYRVHMCVWGGGVSYTQFYEYKQKLN